MIKFLWVGVVFLFLAGGSVVTAGDMGTEENVSVDGDRLLRFYKTVVSATDGDRCGMYPSCSTYAAEAVKKHGAFMGWIMACDRLMRCGRDETSRSAHMVRGNRYLTRDTLADNDFWWSSAP